GLFGPGTTLAVRCYSGSDGHCGGRRSYRTDWPVAWWPYRRHSQTAGIPASNICFTRTVCALFISLCFGLGSRAPRYGISHGPIGPVVDRRFWARSIYWWDCRSYCRGGGHRVGDPHRRRNPDYRGAAGSRGRVGTTGALLVALPALSIPSIVMVGQSLGWRATTAMTTAVAIAAVLAGGLLAVLS